jgi:hypothetical protein
VKAPASTVKSAPRPSFLLWTVFLLLCVIGAGAVVRRLAVLIAPPAITRTPALDAVFASRQALTLCHIVPALLFVTLLPVWFLQWTRSRPTLHRRISYALLFLGAIVGVTALLLSLHPFGGVNEAAAAILYDCLFLFSLARAWLMLQRNDLELHRTWMVRATAVLLGIATTRPVMGFFFATESITHLRPQQFFGTAFWIGFTATYIAGEAYLRSHPSTFPTLSTVEGANRLKV